MCEYFIIKTNWANPITQLYILYDVRIVFVLLQQKIKFFINFLRMEMTNCIENVKYGIASCIQ